MQITFENKKFDLGSGNFVAAGGEGTVYRYDDYAFKIFHKGVIAPSENKLKLLQKLNLPEVNIALGKIKPDGLAYKWVTGKPLSECVTNDFWRTFSYDKAENLANLLKNAVVEAHNNNFVLVDLNGNNVLVDDSKPVVIDVEAWSIPGFETDYKTAKISPAIRDWQKQTIGKGADWFAWAVLIFEFYVGLHPFRAGTIPGYGKKDWQKRMEDGKSAFLSKSLSPNCRPLDGIPLGLRSWMESVFAGDRTAPPDVRGLAGFVVHKQIARAYDQFELLLLQEYPAAIISHRYENGFRIVKTQTSTWVNKLENKNSVVTVGNELFQIKKLSDRLVIERIRDGFIPCDGDWGVFSNKIYSKAGDKFLWYKLAKLGSGFFLAPEKALSIYPFATKVFNGFCIVDAEGKKLLVSDGVYSIRELDDYKITNGFRLSDTDFIVIGEKNGEFTEFFVHIIGGVLKIATREVESATILAVSPRKDFVIQFEQNEIRLTAKNQVKTFSGAPPIDLVSHEDEKTVVAIGNKLFQFKTK